MSNSTSSTKPAASPKQTATPTNPDASFLPPEEQYWKRYSPHGEAPLSFTGSVALHLLVGGIVALFCVWLVSLDGKLTTTLPVEPVRFAGGGGDKRGQGDGPGIGARVEDVPGEDNLSVKGLEQPTKLPDLKPAEKQAIAEKFDSGDVRYITEKNSESARAFAKVGQNIRNQLTEGVRAGKGQGGSGSGGGKDSGKGIGEGPGSGAGRGKLTLREKRMLRWHMKFTANTGPEYLAQLRGLGAILAVPVREGATPEYHVIRELKAPATPAKEDLAKIDSIYWIDDKPHSVRDIMSALRLNMRPSHFVAFMPKELEDNLFRMEKSYVENFMKRTFDEDKIDDTNFRVVFKGGKFLPELESVSMRQ